MEQIDSQNGKMLFFIHELHNTQKINNYERALLKGMVWVNLRSHNCIA